MEGTVHGASGQRGRMRVAMKLLQAHVPGHATILPRLTMGFLAVEHRRNSGLVCQCKTAQVFAALNITTLLANLSAAYAKLARLDGARQGRAWRERARLQEEMTDFARTTMRRPSDCGVTLRTTWKAQRLRSTKIPDTRAPTVRTAILPAMSQCHRQSY